jgi:ferredoxin
VRIDRTLCVGFAECIKQATEAFVLDGEGIVTFLEPEQVERERLVGACDACPVDALAVWDESGNQIVPP